MPLGRIVGSRRIEGVGLRLTPPRVRRGPAAMCWDLGPEPWWPDPASVEHAREVGLRPEIRVV